MSSSEHCPNTIPSISQDTATGRNGVVVAVSVSVAVEFVGENLVRFKGVATNATVGDADDCASNNENAFTPYKGYIIVIPPLNEEE